MKRYSFPQPFRLAADLQCRPQLLSRQPALQNSLWAPGAAPSLVSWGLGMVTVIWHCTIDLSFPTPCPHLCNVPLY